ncbi:MAG TPA: amylo-alpha-1,6-glucosidase [Gemmatimonadaceae bacterium]|nr:amylo-alpha-1,6-glucosidase [Gemmatimonadaceae bacterium]
MKLPSSAEWLEADGLGGFAFGRADGIRTRRYHALLAVATTPPTGRVVLVNGFDAWVETAEGRFALTSQRYAPNVTHPDGATRLASFTRDPWPRWTYALPNGVEVVHELIAVRGAPLVALSWRPSRPTDARLVVQPYLSGRDAHALHHENPTLRFDARVAGRRVTWQPYGDLPPIIALANGEYLAQPSWYRQFQYDEERARGLDYIEDLAAPGTFTFSLSERAVIAFSVRAAAGTEVAVPLLDMSPERCWEAIETSERQRRSEFPSSLHRAADDYIVARGGGKTIIAGYPWFSDWGRDTFIALRGLCLAGVDASRHRTADACHILLEWAKHVSEGMLPNYFPEGGREAEFNSVDASLWYVVAVHDFLQHAQGERAPSAAEQRTLHDAVDAIVNGYAHGTRYGIRADGTGLLMAGQPGVQLTWMDAKVGNWVVTPRIGKPVEIQALWINALRIAGQRSSRWAALASQAQATFNARFWNAERGYLFDVVDVDHRDGVNDPILRPNQIFAVGGLPYPVVDAERARTVVDIVERQLWTPAGIRSLGPAEPGYVGRYRGGVRERDGAYHQGTVWPWLTGAFVEAWLRVRGDTADNRREATRKFLEPLLRHFDASAPGHVAEIADGDAPHVAGGCPFQAWSVGEALRLSENLTRG